MEAKKSNEASDASPKGSERREFLKRLGAATIGIGLTHFVLVGESSASASGFVQDATRSCGPSIDSCVVIGGKWTDVCSLVNGQEEGDQCKILGETESDACWNTGTPSAPEEIGDECHAVASTFFGDACYAQDVTGCD